jgi:hypothetical protein
MHYSNHHLFSRIMSLLITNFRAVIIRLSLVIFMTIIWFSYSFEQTYIPIPEVAADGETLTIQQSVGQHFISPYPDYCSIHAKKLREDKVRIGYGLIFTGPNNDEIFPYSNKWIAGGCLSTRYKYTIVMYCPKCRDIETRTKLAERALFEHEQTQSHLK